MQLFPFTSSCKSPNSFTQQRAPHFLHFSLAKFHFFNLWACKRSKNIHLPSPNPKRKIFIFVHFWAKKVTLSLINAYLKFFAFLFLFWISDKSCNPSSEYDHLSPKFKIGIGIESGQALKKCITSRQNARKPSKKHKHTKTFSKMMIHDVVTYIHTSSTLI